MSRAILYMPKYVIERHVPNAGEFTPDELKKVAQNFCEVINNKGSQVQWISSFVTPEKIYCVYIAANKEMVLEYVKEGMYPASLVTEVSTIIDPSSAN